MNSYWRNIFLLITSGCLICSQMAHAHQVKLRTKASTPLVSAWVLKEPELTSMSSTESFKEMLQNLAVLSTESIPKSTPFNTKQYREKLKSLIALHINQSLQIGIENIKVGPVTLKHNEILDMNAHLQPKLRSGHNPHGLGLEVRIKL